MNQSRHLEMKDLGLFLLIVLAALAIRAAFLQHFADSGLRASPFHVQTETPPFLSSDPENNGILPPRDDLWTLIRNVRESNQYICRPPLANQEEQTAHYSPGYPWLVGLLSRVVPEERLEQVVRWIQVALGALTAGLYYLISIRAFWYRRIGILAGILCACHPFWIVNTGEIQDGVVVSFVLACILYFGITGIQNDGPFSSLMFGISLAALAMARASSLLFGLVGLSWFLLRCRFERNGWICSILAFLGFVNGLAPWAVRNYQVFHQPVPVISSAFLHLWIGNNPKATGGPLTAPIADVLTNQQKNVLAELPQPQRYAELGKSVQAEVLSAPVATLNRRIHAIGAFLLGDYFLREGTVIPSEGLPDDRVNYEAILEAVLLAMLLLAATGWRWTYAWRKDSILMALAIFWLPIPYLLGHAEDLHGPRLPLDGIFLTFAAFTILSLVPLAGTSLLQGLKPSFDRDNQE